MSQLYIKVGHAFLDEVYVESQSKKDADSQSDRSWLRMTEYEVHVCFAPHDCLKSTVML